MTDSEAKEYFEKNSKRIQTKVHVGQIYYKGDEARIAEDYKDLKSGKSFEKVASRRFPNLPKGMKAPWDLGYLYWSQIPASWQDSIDRLKPGQVSDIIKGPNERFWVIKLIDKTVDPNITFAYGKGENRRNSTEAEGRRTLRDHAGPDEGEIQDHFPEIRAKGSRCSSERNSFRWISSSGKRPGPGHVAEFNRACCGIHHDFPVGACPFLSIVENMILPVASDGTSVTSGERRGEVGAGVFGKTRNTQYLQHLII